MLTRLKRKFDKISIVILITIAILGYSKELHSQIQTLDPQKTVNIPTGKMGFSLPLGTVQGVNGNDFPIQLNYSAGISLHQEASEVGLGFSCGIGGISRKVVYVPDDLTGDHFTVQEKGSCYLTGWRKWVEPIAYVVSSFLTVLTCGEAAPLLIFMNALFSMYPEMARTPTVESYRGGGEHTPVYNYVQGEVKGFFKGGETTDLPDMYIINTPYISGTMLWKKTMSDGKEMFELDKNGSAYIICYDKIDNIFTVTLPNGTKLIFDRRTQYPEETQTRGRKSEDGNQCYFSNGRINEESVTAQWHLTKVLYSDYLDGSSPVDDNPLNSQVNNKGSWVCFEYDSITGYDLYPENSHVSHIVPEKLDMVFQASENLSVFHNIGHRAWASGYPPAPPMVFRWNNEWSYIRLLTLKKVVTPNQTADYNFTYDRRDAKWFESYPAVVQIDRGVLSNITIKNKDGKEKQKILFTTSYRLRAKDGNDGSLTLEKLTLSDTNGNTLPPIQFDYVENNPPRDFSHYVGDGDNNAGYCIEEKDLWGYYNPTKNSYQKNDFNTEGNITQANNANAWSLKSIAFPEGYKISWEYEPSRYETANAVPVKMESDNAVAKYGDGIRVKKVTLKNDVGNSKTWSYFYTDENGVFTENAYNSSGYASIEPFAYNLVSYKENGVYFSSDTRPAKARGGLYSPAVVGYGKVQIVEGYNEANPEVIPYGFTVYNFTTPHDYPNFGDYGQQGMDPIRGMVKNVAVYNKNKLIVSQKATFYDVKISRYDNRRIRGEEGWGLFFTVVPTEEHEKINSVEKVRKYSYSSTIGDASDAIEANNVDRYITYEHRGLPLGLDPKEWYIPFYTFYTTDQLGLKGTNGALDIIIVCEKVHVTPYGGPYTDYGIMILQDIGELSETFSAPAQQSNYYRIMRLEYGSGKPSVKVADIDGDGKLDIYMKSVSPVASAEAKLSNVYIDDNGELKSNIGTYGAPTEFDNTLPYIPFRISNEKGMICIRDNKIIIDRDGRPNRTSIHFDNKVTTEEIIPAFTQSTYGEMLSKNILHPICQTTTWCKDEKVAASPYVVAAAATTWSQELGTSAWAANKTYTWKANIGSDGLPDATFENFDHTINATNQNWKQTSTVNKYSKYSQLRESSKQSSNGDIINSTVVYGTNKHLPIASVSNSTVNESVVFTCDYDMNEDEYFDKENGWGNGAGNDIGLPNAESIVCEEAKHFGNKGVKVTNAFGPTRAFKLEKGRDYIFSAWIKKVSGNVPLENGMVIGIDYRKRKSAEGVWPYELYLSTESPTIACNSILKKVQYGDWYYIELPVNAKTDIPDDKWNEGYQYGAAWVGVPNGAGQNQNATVYIDDIRFYPKDAHVTTTYYDETLGLPILSVDANNKPGLKVTYDGFGRAVQWDKYVKGSDGNYTLKTVKTQKYHLHGELLDDQGISLLYPDNAETFYAGNTIKIRWNSRAAGNVNIQYRKENEQTYSSIANVESVSGINEYNWIIPYNFTVKGFIKVAATNNCTNNCGDESNVAFTVENKKPTIPSNPVASRNGTNITLSWQGGTSNTDANVEYAVSIVENLYTCRVTIGTGQTVCDWNFMQPGYPKNVYTTSVSTSVGQNIFELPINNFNGTFDDQHRYDWFITAKTPFGITSSIKMGTIN